jgi:succinyl-CoA synthetase alpha subunit
VAFIAGAAAPAGKKMGHAGAIVTGNAGSYASKRQALEAGGVVVVDTPSQIGPAIADLMAGPAGAKVVAGQK